MTFKIVSSGRVDRWLKMLIHAPHGDGKTLLASTAQDVKQLQNVLMMDVEGGDKVMSSRADISMVPIDSLKTASDVIAFLSKHCLYRDRNDIVKLKELQDKYMPDGPKVPKIFNTVIFDSLAEVYEYLMNDKLGINLDEARLEDEIAKPDWDDWRGNSDTIKLLIQQLKRLPMHVIIICPSVEDINDKTKARMIRPRLPGKLPQEIIGKFDIVAFLQSKVNDEGNDTYKLHISKGRTWVAKHRLGIIPTKSIESPTMTKVMDLFNKTIAGSASENSTTK